MSQLRELREMARLHDPDFDRIVRPSPGQQRAVGRSSARAATAAVAERLHRRPPPLRSKQIAAIQAEVEEAQRHPKPRSA